MSDSDRIAHSGPTSEDGGSEGRQAASASAPVSGEAIVLAQAAERAEVARYWSANLAILGVLLVTWFTVSVALGILWVQPLNRLRMGGFPLGFWFAHQGSIYAFIVLILVYARYMDRIEARLRKR